VTLVKTVNGRALPLASVPPSDWQPLRNAILQAIERRRRIVSLFGVAGSEGERPSIVVVLADDSAGRLWVGRATLGEERYAALTPECPQAHWFEREIAEQLGVVPVGHPWLKPIRFHPSHRPGHDAWGRSGEHPVVGVTDFFRVAGDEVHEVAVGPVHAGVIEPGHFRFQCHGEHVFHLEISLGYQHRGVERAIEGGPHKRTLAQIETVAGDTSVGHALAYAQAIRGIALELERLANHTGDLGALAGDVAFLPTMSYCGRIRGDFLNLTAAICGSRFGRGLVKPGGVRYDIDAERARDIRERLSRAASDVKGAVELLWDTATALSRFEGTGDVERADAEALGLVGPAARACGIERDVRTDHPRGVYRYAAVPAMTGMRGDVYGRAFVRWLELQKSEEFVLERLDALPDGAIAEPIGALAKESLVVSMVEGWRGEICHVALTDAHGKLARYKITDPSFHNWIGLAMALRGEQISDFPLVNKSFNLSYCGHDL
jgi:Ni,Fe-hydrogenase III large subunit